MANVIEEAKSSRATCRTCRQKIEKGALRFGEETLNQFDTEGGTSYFWHHLPCAAQKRGALLKQHCEAKLREARKTMDTVTAPAAVNTPKDYAASLAAGRAAMRGGR